VRNLGRRVSYRVEAIWGNSRFCDYGGASNASNEFASASFSWPFVGRDMTAVISAIEGNSIEAKLLANC